MCPWLSFAGTFKYSVFSGREDYKSRRIRERIGMLPGFLVKQGGRTGAKFSLLQ
jgi:hypothetical protein